MTLPRPTLPATCLALLLSVVTATIAAPAASANAQAQARYAQERAVCLSGQSPQDRPTCLREAAAALAESRHGGLDDGAAPYSKNQRQRCDALTGKDRVACLARMQGQGSTSGSVAGGGMLRELVTPDAAPPAAASAPASNPAR